MNRQFTVYGLQFTLRFQFSIFNFQWLRDHGKRTVNGKLLTVNTTSEGRL